MLARTARTTAAGTAALALGLLGVGLVSSPAYAADHDIYTSTVRWENVDDETGEINDATMRNFATEFQGWRNDTFDDFPGDDEITLTDGTNFYEFLASSTVTDINQGGISVITMTGTTGITFAADYTVVVTLTLQGNFARWNIAVTGGDVSGLTLAFEGDLGSDADSNYKEIGLFGLVSDDGDWTRDPVIGYSVVSDGDFHGFDVTDSAGLVLAEATGASTFELTVALADYTDNGFDLARAFMEAAVPSLTAQFGSEFPVFDDSTVTVAPVSFETGTPVDQELVYAVVPGFEDYFNDVVEASVTGLPAGLTATTVFDPDTGLPTTAVAGVPSETGTFAVIITFAVVGFDDYLVEEVLEEPLSTVLEITVTAPELAATGTDATPIALGAGLLLLGGAILLRTGARRKHT